MADLQAELDAGLDVTARTQYGETPLFMVANISSKLEIIQALLKAGADVMGLVRRRLKFGPLKFCTFGDMDYFVLVKLL